MLLVSQNQHNWKGETPNMNKLLKCILLFSGVLSIAPVWANGAYVTNWQNSATSVSPASVTVSATAGDTLIVVLGGGSGITSPTVTDNASGGSDTFTNKVAYASISPAQVNGGSDAGIWICPSAGASVTNVTVSWTGGNENWGVLVIEYSGLSTSLSSLWIASQGNIQNNPGTTANAITSGAALNVSSVPAIILGIVANDTDSDTVAGTGFTLRGASTNLFSIEDLRITAGGNQQVTFTAPTHGATDAYWTTLIALGEAGGTVRQTGQFFLSQ